MAGGFNINIEFNARRTGKYFQRLRRRFPKETKKEIKRAAQDAAKEARRRADGPVLKKRTGRLHGGIRVDEKGTKSSYRFEVGTDATDRGRPYPRFQEVGFVHYRSGRRIQNPIWQPVWRWAERRLDKRLRRLMRRLL